MRKSKLGEMNPQQRKRFLTEFKAVVTDNWGSLAAFKKDWENGGKESFERNWMLLDHFEKLTGRQAESREEMLDVIDAWVAVLKRYREAYAHYLGPLKYEIRRPRTDDDMKALVPYVIMSDLFSKPELAWKDAASKLTTNDTGGAA